MATKGWHQRKHKRTSSQGKTFDAGRYKKSTMNKVGFEEYSKRSDEIAALPLEKKKLVFKGGLSDAIVNTPEFEKYISGGHPSGFIGAYERNNTRDKIAEQVLREYGLNNNQIADWMTSTLGRHMMDDPGKTPVDFVRRVESYANTALEDVTIWNDPRHDGSLGGKKRVKALLEKEGKLPSIGFKKGDWVSNDKGLSGEILAVRPDGIVVGWDGDPPGKDHVVSAKSLHKDIKPW
jgi:hypothetical protein